MIISYSTNILLIVGFVWSTETTFSVKQITSPLGDFIETAIWSVEENALYFVDFYGETIFRLDEERDKIVTKYITCGCGSTGLVTLIKGSPGYVIIGVNSSLYVANFNAPHINKALRLLNSVDLGKPDNVIHNGKVDDKGRLWFGTLGKVLGETVDTIKPDQASLYVITNKTYTCPKVALRPVTLSSGLVWSLDNKKMYYNDDPTKKIFVFDFNLATGDIANARTFLDFNLLGISGNPHGMTIDSDGNLWVTTFAGGEVLRINGVTGKIMLQIKLPVDQVLSLVWGGKGLATLHVSTGKLFIDSPKPQSGALFAIKVKGCRGVPDNLFEMKNVENY